MEKDCEIELKLAIHPDDAAAFRRLPLLREKSRGSPTRRKVSNVYFDTPTLTLKQHAMALRLRRIDGKWLQTLKTAGVATGALLQRGEWEQVLESPQLDLSLLRETPLARLPHSKRLHLTLKSAFITVFYRTAWLIELSPGQKVEVALDQGMIQCGDRESVISEIELELVEGSVTCVFDVAQLLLEQFALRPETLSKAERGYRLFHPEPLVANCAGSVTLKHNWLPRQGMQAIIADCLLHFAANVEGALQSDDPEFIHQLRVALRRLRSAIHFFRPANASHIVADLKWLAMALGDARDWDVLVESTLPALVDGYGDAGFAGKIMTAAKQKQADARAISRAALTGPRAALLVLALSRWASVPAEVKLLPLAADESEGESGNDIRDTTSGLDVESLVGFAADEIRRRLRRLLRDAKALGDLSAEVRHRLRIDAKRLRYAIDFFSSLFNKDRTSRCVRTLGRLQDALGTTNDATVAIRLLETLAPSGRFIDFSRGWFSALTHIKLTDIRHHFADLKELKRLWA